MPNDDVSHIPFPINVSGPITEGHADFSRRSDLLTTANSITHLSTYYITFAFSSDEICVIGKFTEYKAITKMK